MKSVIQSIFLTLCATNLLLIVPRLHSQNLEYEVEIAYPEKDSRLEVTVVVGEKHKSKIDYFKNLTIESLRITEDIFKIPFRDNFSVVFDPRDDFHNGLATVIPSNRIYIHTEVPNLESSIGLVREAHLETTVHEMAHMMMIQQRQGIFTPLSWVVGNLSRPNALYPRWVHEGMAVWTESHLGGRGQSGIIQAELRKYAEFYKRNNKHPLRNDLLDGSLELTAMHPGNLPYHFGYLMIDDLMKDENSKSAGELLKKSAVLPGWFFHRLYSKNGKRLGKRFEALREDWAKTPLLETPERKNIHEAVNIGGPFVSGKGLSWFYTLDKRQLVYAPTTYLAYYDEEKGLVKQEFTRAGTRINQGFWNSELNAWILLVTVMDPNTNRPSRKRIYFVDSNGTLLCESSSVDRVREIATDGKTLAWIRTDEEGYFHFEKAGITRDCKISKKREKVISSKVAFERMSHPWIKGNEWLVSKGRGRDLSRDLIIGSGNFSYSAPEGALGYPQFVEANGQKQLVVTWYQKDYRGPALVDLKTQQIKTFAVKTEASTNYALPTNGQIISNVSLWEKDQIQNLSLTESTLTKAKSVSRVPSNVTDKKKNSIEESIPELEAKTSGINADAEVEDYNIFPSIVPRFWYPNYETYDRGSLITGSTFFADLSNNWIGSLLLGYDTGAKRPMGHATFQKNNLGLGMLNAWEFEALSNFRWIGNRVQDIQIAKTQFKISQRLGSRFVLGVYPGAEYRRGTPTRTLKEYSIGAPALSLLFSSPHARNIRAGTYQITQFSDAFYFNANTRWLPQPSLEIYTNFQGKAGPFGYLLGLEYGRTEMSAFPIVYYEWGGRADFSTLDTGFLARGFPSANGPAMQILRSNFEFGFNIWNFQRGIPWNRVHLSALELRPIYEVITNDLYNPTASGTVRKTKIRMGNEYFHTAGVELDIFFQALHYANFKASVGYFHGFGDQGEDNVGFKLQSLSDFF